MYKWHRCEDDMDNCEALEEDFPGEMCKGISVHLPYSERLSYSCGEQNLHDKIDKKR